MKENMLKALFATAVAGVAAYCKVLAFPLVVLLVVMLVDYGTGMMQAWVSATLSSRTGVLGIVKKLCYFFAVLAGGVVDYLLQSALGNIGIDLPLQWSVGLVVVIWLIINELLSILENLTEIGVPLPPFLKKVVEKLKISVDAKTEVE